MRVMRVFVRSFQVTFNKPEKLGSYTCTATNSLGKITRRFTLIEFFKPKTPIGLSMARVGHNYIELKVEPGNKEDQLIGYKIEYEARALDPVGETLKSFNEIDFNTTEGTYMVYMAAITTLHIGPRPMTKESYNNILQL